MQKFHSNSFYEAHHYEKATSALMHKRQQIRLNINFVVYCSIEGQASYSLCSTSTKVFSDLISISSRRLRENAHLISIRWILNSSWPSSWWEQSSLIFAFLAGYLIGQLSLSLQFAENQKLIVSFIAAQSSQPGNLISADVLFSLAQNIFISTLQTKI